MVAPVGNFNLEHSLDVDHINSSDEELLQTTQQFEAGNVQSTKESRVSPSQQLNVRQQTNNGGFSHRDLTPKTVEIGPNQENPARCLVRLYEKYMSLRPKTCNAYYVRPLKYPKRDTWYCAVPVGRHTLSGVVKRLCANAGVDGFHTNHSLRATTATRMYDSGIDEQLIAKRKGHTNRLGKYSFGYAGARGIHSIILIREIREFEK
ncbi:hypothetical protein LOTGIDRAFT_175143 [Lottia gigantea]|uniref:ZMYM2-like/QRICH1 C-terminal domain-containing protein n=1 Tax=Lottia gigantea TaxID=225164 RepID=V4APK7_LOTGI|nr:hypothetical protein LOTGIDRAFT_175143 [Lottia gigantea]ESO95566.1 hypothetical protein LOTGIDRAFT_175143 [Lottia gigantea]